MHFGLPEALLMGLVFMTNSAFADPVFLPRFPLGGGSLFLSDFYLILAFLLMWMSPAWKSQHFPFSYRKHFIVLGAAIAVSVCIALARGAETRYILRELHFLVYYPLTIFFVLCAIRSTEAELRLISVITGVVFISALATFWQVALIGRFEFMTFASPVYDLAGAELDALRIRPPSQWLFVCFLAGCIGAYKLWRKQKALMFALVTLVTICLLLGYSRTYVLGLAAGLGLIFFARKQNLSASIKTGIKFLFAAVIFCVILRATMMKVAPQYWEAFEDRIVAPLTTGALQSNGPWEFAGRLYELQSAMKHITEHPILGLGVGMEYRDILPFEYLQAEVHENPDDAAHYMHNTYIYFWMKYGLLGVLAAVRILVYFLSRAWALARGTGSQAVLFLGVLAAFGALASSNLVAPSFLLDSPAAPTLVGLMAGLVELEHQGLIHEDLRLQPSSSRQTASPAMGPANPEIG